MEEKTKAETGTEWIQLVLQPFNTSVTNPSPIYHNLFKPKSSDDKQKKNIRIGQIKRFTDCIGYNSADGSVDTAELFGKTGRAVVKIKADEGYEPRNEVRKFIKA